MGTSSVSIRNHQSVHDFPRGDVLAAMRRALDFLEANPEIDIPESMGELWIRTLARQNRGELKDKDSVTEWFRRQLDILKPTPAEMINDGEHFGAIRYFGAGVWLSIRVSVNAVCEKTTTVKTVQRTEEVPESTWHCPERLLDFGFSADQETLRHREREMQRFMRGAA